MIRHQFRKAAVTKMFHIFISDLDDKNHTLTKSDEESDDGEHTLKNDKGQLIAHIMIHNSSLVKLPFLPLHYSSFNSTPLYFLPLHYTSFHSTLLCSVTLGFSKSTVLYSIIFHYNVSLHLILFSLYFIQHYTTPLHPIPL